jgi:hypothetical protein
MVIEFLDGGRRELEQLERAGILSRQYPGGIKHARYVRAAVLEAVDRK